MAHLAEDRRSRALTWLGVAVYSLFLCAAPFEHHDLICHLRTPQHCTSCAANALGASPDAPALVGAWALADAGRAIAASPLGAGAALPIRSLGRSPPASS